MKLSELFLESLDSDLNYIQYKYSDADVDLLVDGNTINIDLISVPSRQQGQGIGSDILRLLCEIADKYGKTLKLEAASMNRSLYSPPGKLNNNLIKQDKLEQWYSKFGFVKNGEKSPADHPVMVRLPQSQNN